MLFVDLWQSPILGFTHYETCLIEIEMFQKIFQRPKNYFKLSEQRQWEIDNSLGILDW